MHTMGTVMPAEQLGKRLRESRKRANISPERAGIVTGLSARVIGDWERGYRAPRMAYLRVLADLYGVPLTELVNQNDT